MMTRLPHDVHFVVRRPEKWLELIAGSAKGEEPPAIDEMPEAIVTNEDCWIVSTYLRLRRKVSNVHLGTASVADRICVVSGLDFGIRDASLESFYIGARSDGPDPALCHLRVVQNGIQERAGAGHCIAHWPQPGLLPRAAERGATIRDLVFQGSEANLDRRFLEPAFLAALDGMGVRFHVHGRDSGPVRWNDYRAADLVLAARNLTERDALTKPASKLVNAWLAGVPALLGPEPAFQDLRRSALDYIEVRSPADVVAAIAALQARPALYLDMVRNGFERGAEFSAEKISDAWIAYLGGPAAASFERWRRQGRARRGASLLTRSILHKRARAAAARDRDHGGRILDVA
jgi:hypothetical protein